MLIRIYYEDTDAGGIVYHTNYIKYCERARSEIFFERGVTPTDGDNSGFVVKNIDANFLGTATLGDMVEIQTEVLKQKSASLILKQTIYKKETKIFEMNITLVFVRDGRPKAIPKQFNELFI